MMKLKHFELKLTKSTLNADTLGKVMFCMLAEGGAMGCPGEVIWANACGR